MNEKKLSRRDALHFLWAASGALVLGELSFVGLKFLAPKPTEGEFGGVFNLGPADQVPVGSVTPVESGRFYLVRLDDGGFLAMYRKCTHLGCAVPYEPTEGKFVCPCHGSAFSLNGDVNNAPAPRALDLFQLSIEDGEVLVDTGSVIERDQTTPDHIVYI
jgi:cytochrome b6-f complex iron-sulfur subunit